MAKYLSVLCYPHDDKQLDTVIVLLHWLISYCFKEFNVSINITALPTSELNPTIHNLLQQFLSFSEMHLHYVDIDQVKDLLEIIKCPTDQMLNVVKPSHTDKALLRFYHTAKETASSLNVEQVFQFISLQNLKLIRDQGPYGASKYTYPFSVAIDTTGYKEVIFHEFLHQLSVSEGYDETTHITTCASTCWMQYNATRGDSLCEKHSKELTDFIRSNQLS
jgi:hypothetical protein